MMVWYDMMWYDMWWDTILYDVMWYDVWHDIIFYYIWYVMWYDIWYDMWYILLTAIGLTPGGSSTVHIHTQRVHRTTQWNRIHRTEHT